MFTSYLSRGLQLEAPLSPTDPPAQNQPNCLALKQSMNCDTQAMDEAVPMYDGDVLQDVPVEDEDPLMQNEGCGWERRQTSLQAKERLLLLTESSQQTLTQVGDTFYFYFSCVIVLCDLQHI